uniref:Uncharacterized protein n=1 Tax=Glossina pallidipes TaxID=7398 RepID=A0A1B0A8B3_GLOPL
MMGMSWSFVLPKSIYHPTNLLSEVLKNQHVFTAIPYEQPLSLKNVIFDCQKSNSLASANFCKYKDRYFTRKSKQVHPISTLGHGSSVERGQIEKIFADQFLIRQNLKATHGLLETFRKLKRNVV